MRRYLLLITLLLQLSWSPIICQNRIIISKRNLELTVIDVSGDTLCVMPCAVGLNSGQKEVEGDCKTPEGLFSVISIEDSRYWTHDFKDRFGARIGAYGPWFIRLEVPSFEGIGIHGTCFPESIGSRSSEGCIRLKNDDLVKLIPLIRKGDKVEIHSGRIEPIESPIQRMRLYSTTQ